MNKFALLEEEDVPLSEEQEPQMEELEQSVNVNTANINTPKPVVQTQPKKKKKKSNKKKEDKSDQNSQTIDMNILEQVKSVPRVCFTTFRNRYLLFKNGDELLQMMINISRSPPDAQNYSMLRRYFPYFVHLAKTYDDDRKQICKSDSDIRHISFHDLLQNIITLCAGLNMVQNRSSYVDRAERKC